MPFVVTAPQRGIRRLDRPTSPAKWFLQAKTPKQREKGRQRPSFGIRERAEMFASREEAQHAIDRARRYSRIWIIETWRIEEVEAEPEENE